jgi:hypothetical protein
MIKTIPKDTSCQPTMLFHLQWLLLNQPLANRMRPTKGQCQQRYQFLQPLRISDVSLFQTKSPTLQTPEQRFYLPTSRIVCYGRFSGSRAGNYQVLSCSKLHSTNMKRQAQDPASAFKRHWLTDAVTRKQATSGDLLPAPISYLRIGSDPYAKINPFVSQVSEPLFANKLTVRAQIINRSKAEQAIKLFQKRDALISVRAPFLFKDSPEQRECYPFIAYAKRHDIERRRAQIPIRAIKSDGPRGGQSDKLYHKESNLSIAYFKQTQESLDSFVVGSCLRSAREGRRHLNKVNSLDLNQSDKKLGQEVDSGFIPSYILGKSSLKGANVGHCVLSFQDSFRDVLAKDNGTVAFMHFQRSIFVLY